jgi:predicted alpha/beta superfamily hydrolase
MEKSMKADPAEIQDLGSLCFSRGDRSSTGGTDREPITYGHCSVLVSKVLGEARTLLVYLPKGYDDSSKQYPVLIKLDGSKEVFYQTSMAVWYLANVAERIPDHIVVAIENTDRSRDMAVDGGAGKFLQFIEQELFPFVRAQYRTSNFAILCGQSASSMFACYAFLKRPQLFDAYVFSSFGFSDQGYKAFKNGLLPELSLTGLHKRTLFVANAQADPYDPEGARARNGLRFLDALTQVAGSNIFLKHEIYSDEGHVPYPSLYDGLKWIYGQETRCAVRDNG